MYGYDGHGSVRFLTDLTGAISDTYTYDAFGILIASSGPTENRYRYAGEQFDPDLGLYYNRARYLNANDGRFWTMDGFEGQLEDPLSLHRYLYCHGNPISGVDPSGNSLVGDVLVAVGIAVTLHTTYTAAIAPTKKNIKYAAIRVDRI